MLCALVSQHRTVNGELFFKNKVFINQDLRTRNQGCVRVARDPPDREIIPEGATSVDTCSASSAKEMERKAWGGAGLIAPFGKAY